MKIVYEVRLYDTPLLELILEEKGERGLVLWPLFRLWWVIRSIYYP